MDREVARAAIESLRFGIPPVGLVRSFTVGRQEQLEELRQSLAANQRGALLVKANYGAGKSHLLQIVREAAIEAGYVVSLVVTDAAGGIRFNRMDTIFGAVCRTLELEGSGTGVPSLFTAFAERYGQIGHTDPLLKRLTANGTWSPSGPLSPALQIASRAWVVGSRPHRDLITAWLSQPDAFKNRRKDLYWELVADLETRIPDPRREWTFYANNVFTFGTDGHQGAWDGLASLHLIAQGAGKRGLVLLFDEFEDVIQNLNNRQWQVSAFTNLFRFFKGDFPGSAYFAVTPDFTSRCKEELLERGVYDFPVKEFDRLPAFRLDPIELAEFEVLAGRIAGLYAHANGDRVSVPITTDALLDAWGGPEPDQIRHAIQNVVTYLDRSSRGLGARA